MLTSSNPGPSPISKLHDDILWSIFLCNSHMISYGLEDDVICVLGPYYGLPRPETSLITNRKTSQVCRRWRDLIIASPSVWANAIDLKYLNQRGDEWRNEVLKRTGDAPLSVIGFTNAPLNLSTSAKPKSSFIIPFLLNLLDTEWSRIRTLVISSDRQPINEQLRISALRPSPNLQNLICEFYGPGIVDEKCIPFSNYAPRLHSLNIEALSIDFSGSLWSSNLRYLRLRMCGLDIAIIDLLRTLEAMPFLETLRLWGAEECAAWHLPEIRANHGITEAPPFIFRNLKRIDLQNCEYVVPDLISRMIVPSRCNLDILEYSEPEDDAINTAQNTSPWTCYTSFIKNNLASITDVSYSIKYLPPYIFSDAESEDGEPEDGYTSLNIKLGGPYGPSFQFYSPLMGVSPTAFGMARAISLCDLSNVTTFRLILETNNINDILENAAFGDLFALFAQLQSVKTLHTDGETINLYMKSDDLCTGDFIFPNLDTVFTDVWDSGIVGFVKLYKADERDLPRIVFTEDSSVRCGDRSVLAQAARIGATVGWKGEAIRRFRVPLTDDGVLEFSP